MYTEVRAAPEFRDPSVASPSAIAGKETSTGTANPLSTGKPRAAGRGESAGFCPNQGRVLRIRLIEPDQAGKVGHAQSTTIISWGL